MENSTPHFHSSSNPNSQTHLHNHVNQASQTKAMDNFQEFFFKLAETHPNAPLTPASKTLLQTRFNQFISEYKTPDHPPYSAMIERALRELNEKRGSSGESISQYLEKKYDNLPWAHSMFLKHHLEKLCESGEIVATRDKRYGLPGCVNLSREIKRKPRRRRWRWEWERQRNYRRKSKKRNEQKCEKDEVIKKHQESDEKEQQVTENGAHSEDKSDQTKGLLSCVDGENAACMDELQYPPKSRMLRCLRKPKPDGADVENLGIVDDCRGQDLKQSRKKSERLRCLLKPKPDGADVENLRAVDDCRGRDLKQSGKPADCTSIHEKMEPPRTAEMTSPLSNSKQKLQEVQHTKRRPGRLAERRSARTAKEKRR